MLTSMFRLTAVLSIALASYISYAQTIPEDISNVIEDLTFLSGQYISPAAEAAVYQSSGGWYTSAKKKELWDIELSVQGNALIASEGSGSFLIDETQLQNLKIQGDETSAMSPTALGNDEFVVIEGVIGNEVFEFDSPEGVNRPSVNHLQLQLALGLCKGTTFIGRYSPKTQIKDASYELLGFGLGHSISQWIPELDDSSFSLSLLGTYSMYEIGDNFSEVDLAGFATLNSILVDGETYSVSILGSKAIKNFDFSLGAGLAKSNFKYKVGGEGDQILAILNTAIQTLDEGKTNFKADLGVNYRLNNFSINTMYTFGSYSNIVLGLNYNIVGL